MKDFIIQIVLLAAIICFCATSFNLTWKPFKLSIESFSWGYAVGAFLIIMGVITCIGYARYQGRVESGYYKGYESGVSDCINIIEKKVK